MQLSLSGDRNICLWHLNAALEIGIAVGFTAQDYHRQFYQRSTNRRE